MEWCLSRLPDRSVATLVYGWPHAFRLVISRLLDGGGYGDSPFGQGFLMIGYAVVASSWTLGWSLRPRENPCYC
jgi:hypothetical protein